MTGKDDRRMTTGEDEGECCNTEREERTSWNMGETEKERENRMRRERREKGNTEESLNPKQEYSRREGETYREKWTEGDIGRNGGEGNQKDHAAEIQNHKENHDAYASTSQRSNKSTKRKSETGSEENRKKKGREEEEQIRLDEERKRREGEESNLEVKVRDKSNTREVDKENNDVEIGDIYKWKSKREEYLITIAIDKDKSSSTKKSNLIKIYSSLMKTGVRFESLKMVGFNRAEVKYRNRQDANKILMESRLKPAGYSSYIPPRWKMRKGVIHEWEESIEELEKQIAPDQGVFTFEKLKKRKIREGRAVWEEGKSILIKVRGDSLPTKILVGWGHVWLRVEPFVEAVKQCFRCLKFGHIQATCRATKKRCFVCTKEVHGKCEERAKCINCGEGHLSVARECQIYQREAAIKKIMAYKNVSYNTANETVRKEERFGDRWNGVGEENEEDEGDKDFPAIRGKRKVEYWEDLAAPVERELGRLRKVWDNRNKKQIQNQNQDQDQHQNHNHNQHQMQRNDRRKEEKITGNQDDRYDRKRGQDRWNRETRREEEKYIRQERTYRRDRNLDNNTEERARKEESNVKKDTEYLKNRGDDDLIEEIVKLINDRNILAKLVRKLVEKQKETQTREGVEIETEEDWNGTAKQMNEACKQTINIKTKEKITLVNKCFTEEDKTKNIIKDNRKDSGRDQLEEENGKQVGEEVGMEEEEGKEDRGKNREKQVKKKKEEKEYIEGTTEEEGASEAEDWKSVTTGSENTGTIEWLEDSEWEQDNMRKGTPTKTKEKEIEENPREKYAREKYAGEEAVESGKTREGRKKKGCQENQEIEREIRQKQVQEGNKDKGDEQNRKTNIK